MLSGNDTTRQQPKDDEKDLIELMVASSTITPKVKGSSSKNDGKKRYKQQRDLEANLTLLLSDSRSIQEEKALCFAQAYFLKAKDRLDDNTFQQFLEVLSTFDGVSISDLYQRMMVILESHSDLAEEFQAFLLPEQAMELGCYMSFLSITRMRDFFRKLEIYFAKQPQQMRKVYECLCRLVETPNVTQEMVRTIILPLLKNSPLLTDYFLQLFPGERPNDSQYHWESDFEKLVCDEDIPSALPAPSGVQLKEEANPDRKDVDLSFETVEIPETEDPYGGENCPCNCHGTSQLTANVTNHCFSCGLKFIDGRVFIQSGKMLRPAKLVVEGVNRKEMLERICAPKSTLITEEEDKERDNQREREREKERERVGGGKSRKRPAESSSSLVKGSLLSPGTESEDDADGQGKSGKSKSPRIDRVKPVKCRLKLTDEKPDLEESTVNMDSFVLLKDIKRDSERLLLNRSTTESEKSEDNTDDEDDDEEEDDDDDEDDIDNDDDDLEEGISALKDEEEQIDVDGCFDDSKCDSAQILVEVNEKKSETVGEKNSEDILLKEEVVKNEDEPVSESTCLKNENENPTIGEGGNDVSSSSEIKVEAGSLWTKEEDKVVLQAFQQEGDSEETVSKIRKILPARTVEEIESRFQVLMVLLKEMAEKSNN